MTNTLYINGCSWVEGYMLYTDPNVFDTLTADGYSIDHETRQLKHISRQLNQPYIDICTKFNFAPHVAQEFNIGNITNSAYGGGSNDRIVRTTIEHFKKLNKEDRESTFVIIGWTLPERNEMFVTDGVVSHWALLNPAQSFEELQPNLYTSKFYKDMKKFWEMYVGIVYNYEASIKKYFQQVYMLHTILEHLKVRHYFFNSFNITTDRKFNWELHQDDVEWFNQQLNFRNIDDTFGDFIGNNQDLMIHDHHPNVLGHKLWADKLIEDIKNKGLL